MIPITSGLGLGLVWLGSMVVSVVIYGTVEPCGRAVTVFFLSAQISLISDVMESHCQASLTRLGVTVGAPQP